MYDAASVLLMVYRMINLVYYTSHTVGARIIMEVTNVVVLQGAGVLDISK